MWDEGSKTYSEVVKSYICKHGLLVQQRIGRKLTRVRLAAIHAGGSANYTANVKFGKQVFRQSKLAM